MRMVLYSLCLIFLLYPYLYSQQDSTDAQQSTTPGSSPTTDTPTFCKNILDENQHILIPKKGFVMLYFYDPRNEDSINMKTMVNNMKLDDNSIVCFQVNGHLSQGLKSTYRVDRVPSIVILQDKKVIYGINGFTDDINVLTETIRTGIKNNQIVSPPQ